MEVVDVVELTAAQPYPQRVLEFLETASHSNGAVLFSVEGRRRLQELLEETQSHAEGHLEIPGEDILQRIDVELFYDVIAGAQ